MDISTSQLLSYWSITLKFLSAAILIFGLVVLLQQSDFIWMDGLEGEFDSA